ncbi:MAG: DUF3611 family protein [Cyanobacteriota bacterium]|nr:DUF3611 family protein [Cyanobacteriota bacterium]
MSTPLSNSPSPTKREFSRTFRLLSRVSFWLHILLGGAAGITLFLVILSRSFSEIANPFVGLGIFLAIGSLLVVGFRVYWAYRYTRLAKLLRSRDRNRHPSKTEIINVLRIGALVSFGGLLLGFLAAEVTTITVLAKSLSQPQGVAVYSPENIVRAMDLFLVLATLNLIGAHFLGAMNSLGLLNWLED